jgi:hypothetical protein
MRDRPLSTPTHLIVVMAFDRGEDGTLGPAFDHREFPTEGRAIREAKMLAATHAGVIAWSREARLDVGEYGEPVELFRAGEVQEME